MSMSGGAPAGAPPAGAPAIFAEHVCSVDLGALTVLLDVKRDAYLSVPSALLEHVASGAASTPQSRALHAALDEKGLLAGAPRPQWRRFLSACWWARGVLASRRLDRAATCLQRLRRRNGAECAPQVLAQGFEIMRPWYPRRRVCLFDSLALMRFLTGHGARGDLVFGVRGMPFAAHCWVECDGAPLNDEAAYCASFRTIWRV